MSQRGALVLFIFVLIVGVLIGGLFYVRSEKSEMAPVGTNAEPVVFPVSTKNSSTAPAGNVGSASLPSGAGKTWKTYRNDHFNFKIDYPAALALSSGDGFVLPPAGPYYASETPSFWFATMSLDAIESSPGKPVFYASLVVMPTQCFRDYWGNPPITVLTVNGIQMQKQDFSKNSGTINIGYMFSGDPQHRWSRDCNTILISVPGWDKLKRTDPEFWEPPLGKEELYALKTYEQMLSTFRFTK